MSHLSIDRFRQTLLDLLIEAYDGPQAQPWFVSHDRPNPSLFGTLAELTAEEASTPAVEGGHSVAAHTEHLRWSLNLANTYCRGDVPTSPWSESWSVQTVNEAQWQDLQQALREQYDALRSAIGGHSDFTDDLFLHGTMSIVPHTAYHLGAIRQLARILKERGEDPSPPLGRPLS